MTVETNAANTPEGRVSRHDYGRLCQTGKDTMCLGEDTGRANHRFQMYRTSLLSPSNLVQSVDRKCDLLSDL